MMNFTLITALLCTFSWISVSVSEFHTVEVQPGEEVTLLCTNFTSSVAHILWFRLSNEPNASQISSMFTSDVDLSDSGLYFCGLPTTGNSVISSATYLKVQERNPHGETSLSVILGAGTFLITAVTAMAVTISKRHTADEQEQNPQSENLDSDDLKDAALSLCSPTIRNRRPASERQVETHVIYAASR
ncbi:uncharacterized protein LOC108882014 isoform X4 [Lates calcarifer]|uniref:Uncharacterized protein LOC108882014 isoform X4 n=1 Tax=Lates calcarifer TaxID=8187 RepID=A0AAJ7PKM2_LATCA|nr:uncharacterized protein LOC108882014 isoform X4 [Lates calcarifer]